jgi:glycerophosphoryl diester phosphodiesterase
VLALAYVALWIVRLARDFEPVARHPFVAGPPMVIAHRGASAEVREHSMASYRRAVSDGADALELDIHRARDGALVVSHDRDLGRALGVPLAIAEHDLAALRAAVAARHPGADPAALLPTLDEVMVGFPGVRLNIELKADSAALADAVVDAIARHDRTASVLVASFHGAALAHLRARSRGTLATSAGPGEGVRFYLCYLLDVPCRPDYQVLQIPPRLRASWPRFGFDSADFLAFAHRHGLAVHYWTIDDPGEMRALLARGADGIITDRPAVAAAVRDATRPAEAP